MENFFSMAKKLFSINFTSKNVLFCLGQKFLSGTKVILSGTKIILSRTKKYFVRADGQGIFLLLPYRYYVQLLFMILLHFFEVNWMHFKMPQGIQKPREFLKLLDFYKYILDFSKEVLQVSVC